MTATITAQALVSHANGNLWENYGHSRVYFNDLASLIGLSVNRYNTGNVSSASLDGERISNSEAKRILNGLYGAKVWFENGEFHGKGISQDRFDVIVDAIKAKLPAPKKSPKAVMTRAWEIAREGAATHGGKPRDYIARALKLAWAE